MRKMPLTFIFVAAIILIACDSMKPILLTVPPPEKPLFCGYRVERGNDLWLLVVPEDTPYTDEFIPSPFNTFNVYNVESGAAGFVSLLDSTLEFNANLVGKPITLLIDEHEIIPLDRVSSEKRITLAEYKTQYL